MASLVRNFQLVAKGSRQEQRLRNTLVPVAGHESAKLADQPSMQKLFGYSGCNALARRCGSSGAQVTSRGLRIPLTSRLSLD